MGEAKRRREAIAESKTASKTNDHGQYVWRTKPSLEIIDKDGEVYVQETVREYEVRGQHESLQNTIGPVDQGPFADVDEAGRWMGQRVLWWKARSQHNAKFGSHPRFPDFVFDTDDLTSPLKHLLSVQEETAEVETTDDEDKTIEYIETGLRIVNELKRQGYDPAEVGTILAAAAVTLERYTSDDGGIERSDQQFRDAMIKIDAMLPDDAFEVVAVVSSLPDPSGTR